MTTVILSSTKPPDGLPDQADVTTCGFGTTETITEPMLPTRAKLHRRLLVHATSIDQLATEAALLELAGEETRIAPFSAPSTFWHNADGHARAYQTSNVVAPQQPDAQYVRGLRGLRQGGSPLQPDVLYK